MDDSSPTARALLTLELVQGTGGITAQRLADKLGVSERAARRYVAMLREADIPVESTRGPYGGYRLGRGARIPPLMFSTTEALGLVMAVLDGHHATSPDGGSDDPVADALAKLVRVLPEPVAAQVDAVRRTTSAAPDRAAARPDPGTTLALVQACAALRPIRIEYRSEAGNDLTVELEPWAVVVRHGRWYLLCHVPDKDAPRAYRVDRVREVEVLDGTVTLPTDLDPVAVLEANLASGWEHETEVVVEAPPTDAWRWLPRTLGRLEPLDGGRTRLVGSTSDPRWYAEQLARIPVPFTVVGSDELRAAVRTLGERLCDAAEPGDPSRPS